jgi:lactoylglutathione lyase
MTIALQSFAIFVSDLGKAREFYETQLGLPLNKEGAFGFEFFETAPHLSVHPANHPDARALVGRHTGITLQVSELLDLCSALIDGGANVVTEPVQQDFGMMAMVADPDGNVLALWEDNVTPPEDE